MAAYGVPSTIADHPNFRHKAALGWRSNLRAAFAMAVINAAVALATGAVAQVMPGAQHRPYPNQLQHDLKGELGKKARQTCNEQFELEDPPESPADFLAKYGASVNALYNDCVVNALIAEENKNR
jgi:hypothetical protein